MTDPVTNNYGLTLPQVGGDTGTWGGIQNNNIFTPLDNILGQNTAITITSADVTLTNNQFQSMAFTVTGTLTGNRNLIIPLSLNSTSLACGGSFVVANNSSGAFTLNVKTQSSNSGAGVSIPQGSAAGLYSDGSNVFYRDSMFNAYAIGVNGNPNGQLAGTAGSANTNTQLAVDYTNGAAYFCSVTGNSTGAVWTAVAGAPGFNMPQNLSLSASVTSNILTVSVLAANTGLAPTAGNTVTIPFRDATAAARANGNPVSVSANSALTISTIVGATQGATNGAPFRLWIVVFNNGGTPVLGLINCSNASTNFQLNETLLASSTQMSNTATSAGVIYTPSGTTVTNKAFRIIGFLTYETALATAGTYNNAPDVVQIFGPGIKKPGDTVQSAYAQNGTLLNTANTYTPSATPPTAAGGVQAVNASIVPTSGANILRIKGQALLSNSGGNVYYTNFLYDGSNALAVNNAQSGAIATLGTGFTAPVYYRYRAPGVSSITYSIYGTCNSGTTYVNGNGTTQYYGGATATFIEIEEIMG